MKLKLPSLSESLKFRGSFDGKRLVVMPNGALTVGNGVTELGKLVRTLQDKGYNDLILEMSATGRVDSIGIGELVSAFTRLTNNGGTLTLNNVPRLVQETLHITMLYTVFDYSETKYPKTQFVEITPDDLTPLLRSTSVGSGALDLLLSLSDNRIRITPGRQAGMYRISGLGGEDLLIAAPYVIANATRSYLQDEIAEFEELINSPRCKETDVQLFLESHQKFILGQHYRQAHPHLMLERDGNGPLIPDFLLQPYGTEYADLLEIKLPDAKLMVGSKNRKRLSGAVLDAAAQLREYRDYFDDERNRKEIKRRFGVTAYKPRMTVLIGRPVDLDHLTYQRARATAPDVEIITYNDLIKRAKNFLLL